MTIKAELIGQASHLIRHERPFYIAKGLYDTELGILWSNTDRLSPGLRIEAKIKVVQQSRTPIQFMYIGLSLNEGADVARLTVTPGASSELYENAFGQYFLYALKQYTNVANGLTPVGMAGLSTLEPQQLVVYND